MEQTNKIEYRKLSTLKNWKKNPRSIKDKDFGYADDDWVSEEQKQKAIATNDCWTLQWYPHTPVGFYKMSAADLDVLLEAAGRLVA